MTYTATPATMHSGHDIRDDKGSMVAIVHNPAADPDQGAKIAALMAAAPELLAALQGAIETADGTAGMSEAWWYAHARYAIARATGAAQ